MKKYLFLLPLACLAFAGCNDNGPDEDPGKPIEKEDSTALTEFAAKVGNGVKASYDGLKTGVELKSVSSFNDFAFHAYVDYMNIDVSTKSFSVTIDAKAVNLDKNSSNWEASVVISTQGSLTYLVGENPNEPLASETIDLSGLSVASYLKGGNLYVDLSNEKLGTLAEKVLPFVFDADELEEMKTMVASVLVKGYLPDFMSMISDEPIELPELDATVPSYISAGFVTILEEAKQVEGLYESIQLLTHDNGAFGVAIPNYSITPNMGENDSLTISAGASVDFDKNGLLSNVKANASVEYESKLSDIDSLSIKGSVSEELAAKFGISDAGIPSLEKYVPFEFF